MKLNCFEGADDLDVPRSLPCQRTVGRNGSGSHRKGRMKHVTLGKQQLTYLQLKSEVYIHLS